MGYRRFLPTTIEIIIFFMIAFMAFWVLSLFSARLFAFSEEQRSLFIIRKAVFVAICLIEALLLIISTGVLARIIGVFLNTASFYLVWASKQLCWEYLHDSKVAGMALIGGVYIVGLHAAVIVILYFLEILIPRWRDRGPKRAPSEASVSGNEQT